MHKRTQTFLFILADWFAAALAWGIFYGYRKLIIESQKFGFDVISLDKKFYLGILLIPVCWVFTYYFLFSAFGWYGNILQILLPHIFHITHTSFWNYSCIPFYPFLYCRSQNSHPKNRIQYSDDREQYKCTEFVESNEFGASIRGE